MSDRDEIRIGAIVFDAATRDLRDNNGNRIELRNKSSEVLARLAEQPGKIVSKSDIMDAVWPDVTVSDENLTQCIAEIRKVIGDKDQALVKTYVGKGYSLNVTVGTQEQPAHSKRKAVIAGLLVLAIAAIAVWAFWPDRQPAGPARIAVLAFDDHSTGAEQGWLSDAIAEGLITELARYREFQVIARNSSFSFRNSAKDIIEIATELNADYVIEGSQQKSGDNLRVTAQMIDGSNGSHLWAGEIDAGIGELFDVQSRIVLSIATQIGYELIFKAPRAGGEQRVSALHYFVKGNEAFYKGERDARIEAAEYYQKSIETDPKAPFGYSGMATLIWADVRKKWVFPDVPRDELLQRGVDYAEKAIALDETYYRGHIARGDIHYAAGEHEEAIIRYQIAAELNPSNSESLAAAAEPLLYLDRVDESIEMMERAITINPIAPGWYRNNLSRAYWAADRCEEGVQQVKKVRDFRPWDYRALIVNLVCLGDIEAVESAGLKLLELDPDFSVSGHGDSVRKVINNPKFVERWLNGLRAAGLPE